MRLALSRAGTVIMLGLAAVPAAARPSSVDVSVDPRFELLSVVRRLSGPAPLDAADEKRFGAFRDHPAVALYRDLLADPAREEAAATAMIYLAPPPGLELKDRDADVHFVNGPGEAEEMQRFLSELRSFARASDFMGGFRADAERRRSLEREASKALGGLDPVAEIERYLGVSLASRSHYIVLPRGAATHAFIVPYPLPPANSGASSFDAYTMSPDLAAGGLASIIWPEPLFVFIDPSFYYFEKLNVPDPAAFYGADVARCRAASPDCVKHFAVTAIIEHLERKADPAATAGREAPASELEGRLVRALSARLDEYDADRARYPTLWDFYPRWLSVFEETAFPGRAPRALALPAEPRIRSAADFFRPDVYGALQR